MKKIFDRIVHLLIWVAIFLCGLALADFILHPLAADFTYHSILYRAIVMLLLTPLTLLVGFLIIRRVPGNIVGPLLILFAGTVVFSSIRPEIGPLLFAIFSFYEIVIGWFALILMVLHFPDGKIYPPGAATWIYLVFGISVFLNILIFFSNATLYNGLVNPFTIPALQKYTETITLLSVLILSPGWILTFLSPVLRYRKSSYLERQQIKWLALFGGLLVAGTILGFVIYPLITGGGLFNRENSLFSLIFFTSMSLFPSLAIGVAVLRYRLWDIDIIIHKTLVYSVLTTTLVLIFFGCVALLQQVFGQISGIENSPVAIVLSTLAIAALFNPLRRNIQNFIDRRFYRRKYDAEKALAEFALAARSETDLETLSGRLVKLVEETVQPQTARLWIARRQEKINER
jgi:hypothetical protein